MKSNKTAYSSSLNPLVVIVNLLALVPLLSSAQTEPPPVAWHPLTIQFEGPACLETDSDPNPFLDYRLQVKFTGPSGQVFDTPGYFDGGDDGTDWKVRFTPDQGGAWTYQTSFRNGENVAIALEKEAGKPVFFDGQSGVFKVEDRSPHAPGFMKWGRLEYVGGHYLKFRDGPYWIRTGVDSPENFLAYAGFDNTPPSHRYSDHAADWKTGDPDWNEGLGKAIIGAINSLSASGVNSVYFLTMNIGGDGGDVWPWAGQPVRKGHPANDNLHFDLGKLRQWETVFTHAQRRGIFLHFVLNEAEEANKKELDDGELGIERKLYYRELIARFGHHLAMSWNLCEEYNLDLKLSPEQIRAYAKYIQAIDPYHHPVTVHSAGDPLNELSFTFGDPLFSLTSIQLNQRRIDTLAENLRQATAAAGRPLPVSMDEFTLDVGQKQSWKPFDRPALHRKQKLWPTLMSGGQIEFILEDLLQTESFKTPARQALWKSAAIARGFMEQHLPFWEMAPADELVEGEATIKVGLGSGESFQLGAQVFQKPGEVYSIYYPVATRTGSINLAENKAPLEAKWFNPRSGKFEGEPMKLSADKRVEPGPPPSSPEEDWVLLIRKK